MKPILAAIAALALVASCNHPDEPATTDTGRAISKIEWARDRALGNWDKGEQKVDVYAERLARDERLNERQARKILRRRPVVREGKAERTLEHLRERMELAPDR